MTYSDLLNTIQTRQKELSLSNRQLAIRSGIDPGHMGRILTGKAGMSLESADRIAKALGMELTIVKL